MRKFRRRLLVLSLLVVLLSSFAYAGLNQISEADSPQIRTTLQSQSPDPVEPGQIVTVKFKIENEAKQTSEDVIVKLLPKFPFKLYGDVAEKNIGKLKAVSTGADAVIVQYKLKIDDLAVEGDTELELEVLWGENGIGYTDDEFVIDIQTHDAILDITSIVSDPKQITPGESSVISISVKNLADSLLKDIKLKLDFASADLPLAPYQSSSERRLSILKSGFQDSLQFSVIADPEATPGLYKIPLNISYNDEKGRSFSINDILALTIGEAPKIRPYLKKSTVLQANQAGKVTIEIANAGTSDVKFLELELLPSKDYELVSTSNYIYVGDVDSDDTESEEFDIFINRRVKTLNLPIKLKYYDANNKPLQNQFNLELQLYSSSKLKKFGVLERSNAWILVLILLLAGGGYFYYKKYYKKKKKH